MSQAERGARAAHTGQFVNIVLVIVKLVAGIAGHSGALVADGIESFADNLSGKVKGAIRRAVPEVAGVLIHMEPHNGKTAHP